MEPINLYTDDKTLDALEKIQTREEIEALVTKETLLHATDRSKNTMLHMATRWKNTVLAKYLIESGCTINAKNDLGQTPLALAIEKNCEDIVEILMDAGAEVNTQSNHGKNVLQMIGEWDWKSTKISWYLMEKLQLDCLNNKEHIATKLSEAGWSLHNIVKLNDVGLTELLLQRGYANYIDTTNVSGQTALHLAVKSANAEHVNLLLNYNANVDIEDRDLRTALSYVYDGNDNNPSERLTILIMLLDRSTKLGKIAKARDMFTYVSSEAMNLLFNANLGLSDSINKFVILPALVANKNPGILEALRGRDYFGNITDFGLRMVCAIVILQSVNFQTAEFFMKELCNVCSANESDFAHILVHILHIISLEPSYRSLDEQCKVCVDIFLEYGVNVQLKVEDSTGTIEGGSTIIEVIINNNLFELGKLVLCHLAFQAAQGTSVTEVSRLKINSNDQFKIYFESTQQRLKMKIYRSITLFDLLTITDNNLESYVRNQELLSKIQDTTIALSDYKYFYTLLQKRITPAIAIVVLKKKAASIICKIMGTSYDRFPLIADMIVNYLEQQDMKNLIEALP